jgi:2-phospho-L-lactate guanylyltransferase
VSSDVDSGPAGACYPSTLARMDAGLVPIKSLSRAKERLSSRYDQAQRIEIARALLQDLLALTDSFPELEWWFVTDDDDVAHEVESHGHVVRQESGGLNEGLKLAIEKISAAGAHSVTMIPADAPLAWKGDLQDLLDTGATSDVVLVPSRRDAGTNGLYMSPPDLINPRFGPGSLSAHLAQAETAGVRCSLLELPRLGLDIDDEDDVDDFLDQPRADQTNLGRVLTELAGPRT